MHNFTVNIESSRALDVHVTEDAITVDLSNGRAITVSLSWFPRLKHGRPEERENWKLIGNGHGIRWPDLDVEISVEGLLAGKPSSESQASFKMWLKGRVSRSARS